MRTLCLGAIVGALVAASPAHAGRWWKSPPYERTLGLQLQLGTASMTTFGDQASMDGGGEYSGAYFLGTFAGEGMAFDSLHGVSGLHGRLDFLIVGTGVARRTHADISNPPMPRGYLGALEIAGGPLFDLFYAKTGKHALRFKPEAFIGTDRFGVGLTTEMRLYGVTIALRLRSGYTWDIRARVLEEELRIAYRTKGGFEGGFIRTHGQAEDEMGRADLRAIHKGGYVVNGLYFAKAL